MEGFGAEFNTEIKPVELIPPVETPTSQPIEPVTPEAITPNETPTDINPTPTPEVIPAPAVVAEEVIVPQQITQEQVLEYFKANNRDVQSVDDLFKEKEVVKEINPWEDILDEEDRQYLSFKKETGRGRKEFDFLNQDLNSLDSISLATERIKRETGLELSREKTLEYLEEKFDIDLSDDELSVKAQIELNGFVKPIKDEYASMKEQYRKPIENKTPAANQPEMVQLTDGSMMRKEDYDNLVINHQKHIEASIAAVNGVAEASFKVVVDDNGTNREVSYGYEYSPEDKQNMMSIVGDVDGTMQKRYRSENGFNHKQFAEDMFYSDPKNREKVFASIAAKARAEAIEEVMSVKNNANFDRGTLPGTAQPNGQKTYPIGRANSGFGFDERFK